MMDWHIISDDKVRARVTELGLAMYGVLGEGASGVIYSARGVLEGTSSEGTYAVKVITKDNTESITREIDTSNMLKESPVKGAVRMFHAELIDDTHGLVIMERMDTDLARYLEDKRFLSEYDAKKIIIPVLDAICVLNERGYMHRDIKLGNILMKKVGDEWVSRLGDFGEARMFSSQADAPSNYTVIGTAGFAPLEVFSGNYNEKADMWSLGVVMYRMLYGHMPFNCSSAEEYSQCLARYTQSGEKGTIFDEKVRITAECREFLRGLLDCNDGTRWSCTRAAGSTFVMQSITVWYADLQPAPSFKRVALTRKDIDAKEDVKDITWGSLAAFVASRIGKGDGKCENSLVVTKDGRCVDLAQKVDETGMFNSPIEALVIFKGDDSEENKLSFESLESEEEERYLSVIEREKELEATAKTFESNMNLGRIKRFLDFLSQHVAKELGPLLGIAEKCKESEAMLQMACAGFTHAVSEDLNPGIAKFTQNTLNFRSIPKFSMRTFLPLNENRVPLDVFTEDYGVSGVVGNAKEVTQRISVLRDEVLKLSQMAGSKMLLGKNKKAQEEEEEEREKEGEGDEEGSGCMSEEEIYAKAHECARDLKSLSEKMKSTIVMALEWRFRETWNIFMSVCHALRKVREMACAVMRTGESTSRSEIMEELSRYEEQVTRLLREVEGCAAAPYIPSPEDEIKYLQKDCENLRRLNSELKKQ